MPSATITSPYAVLIPARLDSTRLPNKALADIGGIPMVIRVANQARQSSASLVAIATDSTEIAAVARDHGHEVVMTRSDHHSGTERLAEAVQKLELPDERIVVNVQGDEPEMPPGLIDALARLLAQDTYYPMATAAHPVQSVDDWFNPNVVKVVADHDNRALLFSRAPIPWNRQHLKPQDDQAQARQQAFEETRPLRHIGIYAYRAGFLSHYASLSVCRLEQIEALEQLRVLYHGHPIKLLITNHAPPAGIDTPDDLAAVRLRYGQHP
ncbi:MAG: 3-deoxy-manno-octulosonate cytidylyltransferase [Lautropia sp.]|nr:3-deoxy-manno-octulosonate cytidylyltransferase [Lautropia sp.]